MGYSLMQLRRGILLNTPHIATASGEIATFHTDMAAKLKKLTVGIEPMQSGTGDPSPTNVRPISGWTGIKLERTGKNLLGGEALADSILLTIPNATVDRTNGTITYAGNQPDNNSRIISTGMKFKEDTRYTFLFSFTGERRNVRWFYTDGTYDGSSSVPTSGVYVSAAGKTVASLRKIRYNSNPVTLNYNNCGIFEGTVTAADFEAYNGTTFPFDWTSTAGTVYGGTLDVLTGVLTVTWVSTTINDEKWNYNSSSGHFASGSSSPLQSKRKPGRTNLKSSAYLTTNASSTDSAPNYSLRGNSNVAQIYVKDTRYTDVPSWKAAMGDTQIVYELAEPLIVQLTPEQISALKGTNNIWADTGAVETEYWKHI